MYVRLDKSCFCVSVFQISNTRRDKSSQYEILLCLRLFLGFVLLFWLIVIFRFVVQIDNIEHQVDVVRSDLHFIEFSEGLQNIHETSKIRSIMMAWFWYV